MNWRTATVLIASATALVMVAGGCSPWPSRASRVSSGGPLILSSNVSTLRQFAAPKLGAAADSTVLPHQPSPKLGTVEIALKRFDRPNRSVAYVSPAAQSVVFEVLEPSGLSKDQAVQDCELKPGAAATASIKLPAGKVRFKATLIADFTTAIATGDATADIKVGKDSDGQDFVNHIKMQMGPILSKLKVTLPADWWSAATVPVKLDVYDARGDLLPADYDATISVAIKKPKDFPSDLKPGDLEVSPYTGTGPARPGSHDQLVRVIDARDQLTFRSDQEKCCVPPENQGTEQICASASTLAEVCVPLGPPGIGIDVYSTKSTWTTGPSLDIGNYLLTVAGQVYFWGPDGPTVPVASGLLAKLGDAGTPFTTGSSRKIQISEKGAVIYFLINDSYYDDNAGFYHVTVQKQPD